MFVVNPSSQIHDQFLTRPARLGRIVASCWPRHEPEALHPSPFARAHCLRRLVRPLAPHFSARQAEIRSSTDAPRTSYTFASWITSIMSATGPLHSLDVRVPEDPSYGIRNLLMTVDGNKVSTNPIANLVPRTVSTAFDPVWEQQHPREIVTEWDLVPIPTASGNLAASASAFYIADNAALPLWQTPFGKFSHWADPTGGEGNPDGVRAGGFSRPCARQAR